MSKVDIDAGILYRQTQESDAKVIVHEGGSGSGKTISLLQTHLTTTFTDPGSLTTITRETVPNLKRGPIRDWENVLNWATVDGNPAANYFKRNRQDHTWTNTQTSARVEFIALDDEQKARGPRRTHLHMNEANEISLDTARQLMRRTSGRIYIDFNPSLLTWWVDTEILTRDDVEHILSTYQHNPFLPQSERDEIEKSVPTYEELDGTVVVDWDLTYTGDGRLIHGDPYEWSVYGLGRRGSPAEAIYTLVFESEMPPCDTVLGLDFGFEHPMSLLRVGRVDRDPMPRLHYDQLFHQRGYTVGKLIELFPSIGVDPSEEIICDAARPDAIQEINDAGYNAVPCQKGAGSVIEGIDWMKRHEHHFTRRSSAARTQFANYRRKKIRGVVTEDPLKAEDDAPDAGRYAAYDTWGRPQQKWGLW